MSDLEAELAGHAFLAGLGAGALTRIAAHAREACFAPDERLLREGEDANASFLILEGRVALEIRAATRTVQVAAAGAGEVVGWSWLATPNRWHFDARASGPVRAVVLDGKALLAECDRDPSLGYALTRRFLTVVTARLEAVRVQLIDIYGPHRAASPWE
jgi:CRP-like cAMP-binding protein